MIQYAAFAAETAVFAPPPLTDSDAASLDEIVSSQDFGTEKPGRQIRFKENTKDIDVVDLDVNVDFPWLRETLAAGLRAVLVAAVFVALVFSARYLYMRRELSGAKEKSVRSYAAVEETEDGSELLRRAETFYQNGGIREAWALCFRAFLAALGRCQGIAVPPEATEYEALALAGAEGTGAFSDFVTQWIMFAYGGKSPGAGAFEAALRSCRLLLESGAISARRRQ